MFILQLPLGLLMAQRQPAYTGYDIAWHRLTLDMNPATGYIEGHVATGFVVTTPTDSLLFDMGNHLVADSVVMQHGKVAFRHANNTLSIRDLPKYSIGDFDSLSIFYHGVPHTSGSGAFRQVAVGDGYLLFNLSEPYGAPDWWPCKHDLGEKADSLDLIISVPEGYRVAGIGIRVSEHTSAQKTTVHWKHRYPVPAYLVAVAVGKYELVTDSVWVDGQHLLLEHYLLPDNKAEALAEIENYKPAFQYLTQLLGPFPYHREKYGHVQILAPIAMEYPTMSFFGGFGWQVLVHEAAHQWFGDYITCASWQDIWLNEGFATYLEALCIEHFEGKEAYQRRIAADMALVYEEPDGAVFVNDTSDAGRIFDGRLSYLKGSLILHMLRQQLGDTAFYEGIRNYLSDSALSYNFAHTPDFIRHMEEAADTSLSTFFDDWLYGQGYPTYSARWQQDEDRLLTLWLSQSSSHLATDFFEMNLNLLLAGDLADTTIEIKHQMQEQETTMILPFRLRKLQIDRDNRVLDKNSFAMERYAAQFKKEVAVIPNPAIEEVRVYRQPNVQIEEIMLSDEQGRLIRQFYTRYETSPVVIPMSDLDPGIYLISIHTPAFVSTHKIVKR